MARMVDAQVVRDRHAFVRNAASKKERTLTMVPSTLPANTLEELLVSRSAEERFQEFLCSIVRLDCAAVKKAFDPVILLARKQPAVWKDCLLGFNPQTADLLLQCLAKDEAEGDGSQSAIKESLFEMFEDESLELQQGLARKAEEMRRQAWQTIVSQRRGAT